jgi:hypothetical protein
MTKAEIADRLAWADVIHYHDSYEGQAIFGIADLTPPSKPGVVHLGAPQVGHKLPGLLTAIPGRFRKNDYPDASFVLPEAVDTEEWCPPIGGKRLRTNPVVTPCSSALLDEKNRRLLFKVSESLKKEGKVQYCLPNNMTPAYKQGVDIALDNLVDVGYSTESLEYMACGCPCMLYIDKQTEAQVMEMTGAPNTPWIKATKDTFHPLILHIINTQKWLKLGEKCREWMTKYWSPSAVVSHYEEMYKDLLGKE